VRRVARGSAGLRAWHGLVAAGLSLLASGALAQVPGGAGGGASGARGHAAAAAVPDLADPIRLALPVRCTPGDDCFVQNHFDRDPGPGRRDFACGHLTYDGHRGTDFRVRSLAHMARGVDVVAAAPGVVRGVRDGEPDVSVRERGRENLRGREAGNGVRIEHGDGWETQYSHLMRGSVRVRPGQRVSTGQVLGRIGLSGNTEFPHLDFVVRKDGVPLDPYAPTTAPPADAAPDCATGPQADTLWQPELVPVLRYRATDVLIAGFAPEPADRGRAQLGEYEAAAVDARAPSLVFYVEAFGARRGDRERIEILGPGGRPIVRREREVENDLAVRFGFVGRKLAGERWPSGEYAGRYRLERDGAVVAEVEKRLSLR
jgi:murein DD-endopeptidase MepM/ murein hydrolase activator NlpD